MKRAEKNKKMMKIIVGIVAVAMIASTFASFFASAGSNSGKNTQIVDSDTKTDENINTEITDALRKDMESAKVEVKDKEVVGIINVSEAANKVQADKVADEYSNTLKEKYKDKDIKVQVVHKEGKLSESNTYVNVNKDAASKLPKMNLQISSGLTSLDRYVAVTLDTDKPEQYVVKASGQELKYVASKKVFHGVIESTDEEGIKKSIKVSEKK